MLNEKIEKGVYTVEQLFNIKNLKIPEYQRPYKWTIKNISQLMTDICKGYENDVSAYRLGTVVFHNDKNELNIVDCLSRLLSFKLIHEYEVIEITNKICEILEKDQNVIHINSPVSICGDIHG